MLTQSLSSILQPAHSPLFEEPESFIEVMVIDVLRGNVDLADK